MRGGDASKFIHFPFPHYFLMFQYYFTWPVVALLLVVAVLGTINTWRGSDWAIQTLLGGLALVAAGILLPLFFVTLRTHSYGMPL
jgi:hypothetical protein